MIFNLDIFARMSFNKSKSMSCGDSGHFELALLSACSPSRHIFIEPVEMSYFLHTAETTDRDPAIPANSLRYELCSEGDPGTTLEPMAASSQLVPHRMNPEVPKLSLYEPLLTVVADPWMMAIDSICPSSGT